LPSAAATIEFASCTVRRVKMGDSSWPGTVKTLALKDDSDANYTRSSCRQSCTSAGAGACIRVLWKAYRSRGT
jgi:hypothetical protein